MRSDILVICSLLAHQSRHMNQSNLLIISIFNLLNNPSNQTIDFQTKQTQKKTIPGCIQCRHRLRYTCSLPESAQALQEAALDQGKPIQPKQTQKHSKKEHKLITPENTKEMRTTELGNGILTKWQQIIEPNP